uniref:Uncharacterized protein n=1 Tax=Setaria italica TaxID=4555 RepID=K4AP94_SETIT
MVGVVGVMTQLRLRKWLVQSNQLLVMEAANPQIFEDNDAKVLKQLLLHNSTTQVMDTC